MTTGTTALPKPLAISVTPGQALAGILAFLTFIGVVAGLGRLFLGLNASTMLTDAYPWGIWIGFDVFSDGLFLTPRNLWNLSVQSASVAVMATATLMGDIVPAATALVPRARPATTAAPATPSRPG